MRLIEWLEDRCGDIDWKLYELQKKYPYLPITISIISCFLGVIALVTAVLIRLLH